MAIGIDPENNETRALFDLADFRGQHVLEIGCGDGRLTWRYAGRAAHVTAIDPNADRIVRARENMPHELSGRSSYTPYRSKTLSTPAHHRYSTV
jgi:ubiquinone/menaquinone biosynthesis C-methylase UbiE